MIELTAMNHIGALIVLLLFFIIQVNLNKELRNDSQIKWHHAIATGGIVWVAFEIFYWVIKIFFING